MFEDLENWLCINTQQISAQPPPYFFSFLRASKHNSIGKTNGYYKDQLSVEFKQFATNELLEYIKEPPSNKVIVLDDIPIKIIKNSAQFYSSKLT